MFASFIRNISKKGIAGSKSIFVFNFNRHARLLLHNIVAVCISKKQNKRTVIAQFYRHKSVKKQKNFPYCDFR